VGHFRDFIEIINFFEKRLDNIKVGLKIVNEGGRE
jgi:hypothetical protein